MPVWKKGSWVPLFTWLLKLGYSQTTPTTCERARLRKGKTEVTLPTKARPNGEHSSLLKATRQELPFGCAADLSRGFKES